MIECSVMGANRCTGVYSVILADLRCLLTNAIMTNKKVRNRKKRY